MKNYYRRKELKPILKNKVGGNQNRELDFNKFTMDGNAQVGYITYYPKIYRLIIFVKNKPLVFS